MTLWPNILAWIAGAEASLVMVPQIILMHRLKDGRGTSMWMLALRQFSFSCLVLYVILTHEWTLAASYGFSLIVNAYAWYVKWYYTRSKSTSLN